MVDFRIRIVVDTKGAERGSKRVERGLKRTTDQADRLRATLARAFAILGGFAIIRNTIRTLAAFEQSMSTVRAISGATEVQFKALTAAALELGATTRFSATQAGEGMEFLARAGFEVEEVLAAIGPVLQLAQAGALDLGSAANIASNVLKGFRLEADETNRVVDVLAAAAADANTDVRKLGQALSFVAPVAASMGISVEEAAAAVGVLGDAGIPATRAGRGLNLVLATLEKGSDGLAAAAKRAGLSLKDFKPTAVGIAGALANLEKANISAGEAFDLFGKLGAPAINVLLNGVPRIKEFTKALENSKGAAAEIARIMDDNLAGALFRVRSAFEAVNLALGSADRAGGILRDAVENLAKGLRFLAKNADVLIDVLQALALVVGVKLVKAFVRLAIAIAANPIGFIATAITASIALLIGFADKIKITGDGLTTLKDLGVAAFEALSGSLGVLSDSFTSVGDFAGKAFESIRDGLLGVLRFAATTSDNIFGFFNGAFSAIGVLFDNLPDKASEVGELIKKAFRDSVEAIVDFFIAAFQTLGDVLQNFFRNVQQVIANTAGALGALSKGNLEAAKAFADNNVDALNRIKSSISGIPGLFKKNLRALQGVELLPEVELSEGARNIGKQAGEAFRQGFEESPARDLLDKILGRARELGAARAAEDAGTGGSIEKAAGDMNKLKKAAEDTKPPLEDVDDQLSLIASTLDGTVAIAFRNVGDALLDFAETGKFVFKDFVNQLLDDIARLIVELLVLQAVQAVTGTGAAAPLAPLVPRQHGGPVAPNRPFLIGEQGPELFRPQGSGSIVPAGETAAMMAGAGQASAAPVVVEVAAPDVNVSITNQSDPNEFKEEVDSGRLDISILNVLQRRKTAARQSLGV